MRFIATTIANRGTGNITIKFVAVLMRSRNQTKKADEAHKFDLNEEV